jgi:hypothetical protein
MVGRITAEAARTKELHCGLKSTLGTRRLLFPWPRGRERIETICRSARCHGTEGFSWPRGRGGLKLHIVDMQAVLQMFPWPRGWGRIETSGGSHHTKMKSSFPWPRGRGRIETVRRNGRNFTRSRFPWLRGRGRIETHWIAHPVRINLGVSPGREVGGVLNWWRTPITAPMGGRRLYVLPAMNWNGTLRASERGLRSID